MSDDATWRVSASCGSGNCVQVAKIDNSIAIRDSKNPENGSQTYTFAEWQAFVEGVKRGDFDDLLSA